VLEAARGGLCQDGLVMKVWEGPRVTEELDHRHLNWGHVILSYIVLKLAGSAPANFKTI
jgi:hypothetical protein